MANNGTNEFNESNESVSTEKETNQLCAQAMQLLLSNSALAERQQTVAGMELANLTIVDDRQSDISINFIPPRKGRPDAGGGRGGMLRTLPAEPQPPGKQQMAPGGGEVFPGGAGQGLERLTEEHKGVPPAQREMPPTGRGEGFPPRVEPAFEPPQPGPHPETPSNQEEIPHPPEDHLKGESGGGKVSEGTLTNELLKVGERFGQVIPGIITADGESIPKELGDTERMEGLQAIAEKFGKIIDSGESPRTAITELNSSLEQARSPYRFAFLGPKGGTPTDVILLKDNWPTRDISNIPRHESTKPHKEHEEVPKNEEIPAPPEEEMSDTEDFLKVGETFGKGLRTEKIGTRTIRYGLDIEERGNAMRELAEKFGALIESAGEPAAKDALDELNRQLEASDSFYRIAPDRNVGLILIAATTGKTITESLIPRKKSNK